MNFRKIITSGLMDCERGDAVDCMKIFHLSADRQAEKKNAKRVRNMAKTIITQGGDLVNYANIIAVFVDDELDDDENVLGYNLWGLDATNDNILLGEYLTLDEALQAKNKIVDWIDNEAYAKVDLSEKAGDAVEQ